MSIPSKERASDEHTDVAQEDLREASDAALVVAVGRWHHDALAEAFRRHSGPVFALARRLLADTAPAEEVVQEVFLRLWNTPERFDPSRGSLRSYLLAQCHGRSIDLLRSEGARRRREQRDAQRVSVADYDLEREVGDVIVAEQVREALATLAEEERHAIELAYFGGHTYREVAALLGQPEGTVKSRIRTGMIRLRRSLAATGVEPS
jgi:RNA polymerase sigma-70 factor (ECF subfamily)